MIEFLYYVDVAIFRFFNQTIANPVFDFIMPPATNWNQSAVGISIVAVALLFIFIKGGKRGRTAVLLLIPLIFLSDQLSSTIIKSLVARPRPCQLINGIMAVPDVHLLVSCGGGYSFPSSHAVNNFSFAAFMTFFYKRFWYIFFSYATLMGFSRVSVGVHYPSDVLCGAFIGVILALIVYKVWVMLSKKYTVLALRDE